MRFMMIVYPGAKAETGALPDPKVVEGMMKYNEELQKAGVLLALDGLHPSSKGARVHYEKGGPRVSDGPFTEAKELVGGFWLIQVKSKDEAVAWARKAPMAEGEMIELRQVYEMPEFTNLDPKVAAQAEAIGKSLPGRQT
jgi:hypothetical protein